MKLLIIATIIAITFSAGVPATIALTAAFTNKASGAYKQNATCDITAAVTFDAAATGAGTSNYLLSSNAASTALAVNDTIIFTSYTWTYASSTCTAASSALAIYNITAAVTVDGTGTALTSAKTSSLGTWTSTQTATACTGYSVMWSLTYD